MKLLPVLISLFVFTPSLAFAQTSPRMQLKPTLQAQRQDARQDFKDKLAQIKDARKQTLVNKIDTRIETINTNRTQAMSKSLTQLSAILDRVVSKSATLTPAPTMDKVTLAKEKLSAAQTAVTAQAAKQYVISITNDSTLKTDVMTTLTTFRTDITATHKTVLDAKQAVIDAIKSLEPEEKTSTTPTPESTVAPTQGGNE